jgi:pimeloyl-ACP methyl ester carboxylesterase
VEHAVRSQKLLRKHQAFSETDCTEDLKKLDVPTLVMHGEDDQVAPDSISVRNAQPCIAISPGNVVIRFHGFVPKYAMQD